MLFIDYSSAFNTIVSTKLITKLRILGLNTSLFNWILDFLKVHPQVVRVGNNTYPTLILNIYMYGHSGDNVIDAVIDEANDRCGILLNAIV